MNHSNPQDVIGKFLMRARLFFDPFAGNRSSRKVSIKDVMQTAFYCPIGSLILSHFSCSHFHHLALYLLRFHPKSLVSLPGEYIQRCLEKAILSLSAKCTLQKSGLLLSTNTVLPVSTHDTMITIFAKDCNRISQPFYDSVI